MKEITAKASDWLKSRAKDPERKPFAKESEAFGAFMSEVLFDTLRGPFREAWLQHLKDKAADEKIPAPVADDKFRSLNEGT